MNGIPLEALSDHFHETMRGRRLVAAVFATYTFDPGFFEQEILPVFFDIGFSHHPGIRLVQLEEVIRKIPGGIAVYYDAGGLRSENASARLDVRRISVRHHAGVFHPKNVFLLVEEVGTEPGNAPQHSLIVAALSANLTRSGWWENVEVCHMEEIKATEKTRLRDDVRAFLKTIRDKAPKGTDHTALESIRTFLNRTESYSQRSSVGVLHPHFYTGRSTVADFLSQVAGSALQGTCLEIISPFFDKTDDCGPLLELLRRFQPQETRVHLPKNNNGEASLSRELYESIRKLHRVCWGTLPHDVLRLGKSEDTGIRFVHAKVYRFFTRKPRREFFFLGSPNLTNAAHGSGGNLESGLFVEVEPAHMPDFWLQQDVKAPRAFEPGQSDTEDNEEASTRLSIRFRWDDGTAHAWWESNSTSPELSLKSQNIPIGTLAPLAPRQWIKLRGDVSISLRDRLHTTSFLSVFGEGTNERILLVQEEGMWRKPSVVLQLSVSDILRYWSQLTADQRARFIEERATDLRSLGYETDLFVTKLIHVKEDTLFDRFAGFFHSFGCLERSVCASIESGSERDAEYRLFGKKFDSLGGLLDRVLTGDEVQDLIDRYVILLCARQVCNEVQRRYPDFWNRHTKEVKELRAMLSGTENLRQQIVADNAVEMDAFLAWFEPLFLRRVRTIEAIAS